MYVSNTTLPFMTDTSPLQALQTCASLIDLERPLAVIDIETTGIDAGKDAIIQIGVARLSSGGGIETFDSFVDPGRPVPDEVQELTGITNEMLEGAPPFPHVAPDINRLLGDADLCGYNVVGFDLPFLESEFERHGLSLRQPDGRQVLDVYQIFRKKEPHTLERAVAHYTGQPFEQSHQALDDVEATARVLAVQLARYGFSGSLNDVVSDARHPHLDAEGKLMADGGSVVLCFGKHQGHTIRHVEENDPSYLDWMIREIGGEVGRIVGECREQIRAEPNKPEGDGLPFDDLFS